MKSDASRRSDAKSASILVQEVDPTECPLREFRDNEIGPELWGLGPVACRLAIATRTTTKPAPVIFDTIWSDEETQPLPRSARKYIDRWVRADELADMNWDANVAVFEENKMSVTEYQLGHARVISRSSFCRLVLSACFILERAESLIVEHQWETFLCSTGADGWRPKFHIYSPGMKPGGGAQHKPTISKNGCYLIRLYYLGSWRCVWVSDQVPVDENDAPLLPFSPLMYQPPAKPGVKPHSTYVAANVVYLWPLLLCKALLKLAAPDMNSDEDMECDVDEVMEDFNVLHALTGCMDVRFTFNGYEEVYNLLKAEAPVFTWDDEDEDTLASTVKSKVAKKPPTKDATSRRNNVTMIRVEDTKNIPAYELQGVSPAHEMFLLVSMVRDLPLKKPLPEPDVALWKNYRWVDWAKSHGLYDAYDCPRTKFVKVNGFLKLSYSPHLLDVVSTESITRDFREEQERATIPVIPKKSGKDQTVAAVPNKEELREWLRYDDIQPHIKEVNVLYYPSMFQFTTAGNNPPVRITKVPNRALDIVASKSAPLYLQVDSGDMIRLRISLSMLHPRVLGNCGVPFEDFIDPAYMVLEKFKWFEDCELPAIKAFVNTCGYDAVEAEFPPGRHFCRIWVHSCMSWHVAVLSESTLVLGSREVVQTAAVLECPWISRFLTSLSVAFNCWVRLDRNNSDILIMDREFFRSYYPDLPWNIEEVGYHQAFVHWMFRQALQSLLFKRLTSDELHLVFPVLRHYFCDPDLGMPSKPVPTMSLREIVALDPCDCPGAMPEAEEVETLEEQEEGQCMAEEKSVVDSAIMRKLLQPPGGAITYNVCELATEELPCEVLKEEREKVIRKHEAATVIQAYWRGTFARKCLKDNIAFTPEALKIISDNVFGNQSSLSALMNEFFGMYPGAKNAYSIASGLAGVYGIRKYNGTSTATEQCKWIPYFQGVFYCHAFAKAHFDVQSTLPNSNIGVFNNDTGLELPQAFNAHLTFDFAPNSYGYTVMGHGTLKEAYGIMDDVTWQLTVFSSIDGAFHACDNEMPDCTELPLTQAYKVHVDEIFLPNRRNILGGILLSVTKNEAVNFRAVATSPNLEMLATLRTTDQSGSIVELATCKGNGEIYWPFIQLQSDQPDDKSMKIKSVSHASLKSSPSKFASLSARSLKGVKISKTTKSKSMTRMSLEEKSVSVEPKQYCIEVTAPNGWPLTLSQWKRVIEVRNSLTDTSELPPLTAKEKKEDKTRASLTPGTSQPQPDDAFTELECSLATGGGASGRRDDQRDIEFAAARKAWDAKEPGRNLRGATLREDFRREYLIQPPSVLEQSECTEFGVEEENKDEDVNQLAPSPVTESAMMEMSTESDEETKYLKMPQQLKDKFKPLKFVPHCMKERNDEECVLVTNDMAEAAKQDRHVRLEAALARMNELQLHSDVYITARQQNRSHLLEKLFIDSNWSDDLNEVLEERDYVIAEETLARNASAIKKKPETKEPTAKKKK